MFKSILIATDGSQHAKKAAEAAASMAAVYDAALTIISVSQGSLTIDEIERSPRAMHLSKAALDDIKNLRAAFLSVALEGGSTFITVPAPYSALMSFAENIIDEAEAVAKRAGVKKIERVSMTGNPADRILEQAEESKVDLIVMGTRGLSNLSGLLMGSVSHKVIQFAPCACMTVK
jgi:nucleotide-binding universal stress UspA family protein